MTQRARLHASATPTPATPPPRASATPPPTTPPFRASATPTPGTPPPPRLSVARHPVSRGSPSLCVPSVTRPGEAPPLSPTRRGSPVTAVLLGLPGKAAVGARQSLPADAPLPSPVTARECGRPGWGPCLRAGERVRVRGAQPAGREAPASGSLGAGKAGGTRASRRLAGVLFFTPHLHAGREICGRLRFRGEVNCSLAITAQFAGDGGGIGGRRSRLPLRSHLFFFKSQVYCSITYTL